MAFKETFLKDKTLRVKILKATQSQKLDLKSELKRFLPASQQALLKDFKSTLLAEIERSLPS